MTERVKRLRQESLDAVPRVSTERAELLTAFWRSAPDAAAPVRRAMAFRFLLENKAIHIGPGELIVGERGPAPKATPTYPELCCHSLEDLDILNSRPKIPFAVSAEARELYREEVIPFWRGRSMRDMIFASMSEEWLAAYEAGIFTEFMEQRAPGHTVLGDKIYRQGFLDIRRDAETGLAALDFAADPDAGAKKAELEAMCIAAEAIIAYARRHAGKARELAAAETNPVRHSELAEIARVCERVPAHAPETFWEALQAYWFVHLGVITELNTWDSFNPGRLDQHLFPYYRQGLADGTLTPEKARELLQCFWIKFNNQPAPPKVGVTAAESGTYTDFANINTGGMRADGSDGVNEVTYLILDVIDAMRLLQPSSNIQVSKKNPDAFVKRACRIIRQGWGQPSVFNADEVVMELLRQGKALEDARCGGTSGCVETGAFGKESYILTGYLNLVKLLELALHDGVDPRTGRQLGPRTGDPAAWTSMDDVLRAFRGQLQHFIDVKIQGNGVIERLYAAHMPAPFLSLVIDDCVARGRDYNDGGARYDTSYIQGVGLGSLTDCLSGIRQHVFERRTLTLPELVEAMDADFANREPLRQTLLNHTPRYGNDDDAADALMVQAFRAFFEAVDGRPNTRGGTYRINMLPTTCHVYFGSVTGAMPDGRRAWQPLSEGISPVQGADRRGPTAVIRSAGKLDHVLTGGTLLNMKFTPQVLEGDRGIANLTHLIRAYFRLDGHHVQFNVVKAETLRAAQRDPEKHRDLIVRVAGYSDYFCDLSPALQDEIIARTEHAAL
ncbi:MAG: glycyl radical protein [Bacillota bacterium]|nr:glycyl radical protein [Bacillota bacterium]